MAEHEKGRSYRELVQQDFPSVKPGTLNRFAKSEGEWIPKSKEILAALGLYKPRPPYSRPSWLYRWYHKPKEERYEVMKSHVENLPVRRTQTGGHQEEHRREEKEIADVIRWIPE